MPGRARLSRPLACARSFALPWIVLGLALTIAPAHAEEYLSRDAFLAAAFPGVEPRAQSLWLNGEAREAAQAAVGWVPPALRIRYWREGERTAWILEDIGKEKPITLGVTVHGDAIERVEVMAFRESRGWEIRYPFFTEQFQGVSLGEQGDLSRRIDGITGATLSVSALERMSRLALWLDAQLDA